MNKDILESRVRINRVRIRTNMCATKIPSKVETRKFACTTKRFFFFKDSLRSVSAYRKTNVIGSVSLALILGKFCSFF